MIADLHCHTKISDNSLTIEEVITMAKQAGVSHLKTGYRYRFAPGSEDHSWHRNIGL